MDILNNTIPSYRQLLLDEFTERQKKNSSYSVRAFAKQLGVNKTTLAEVLTFRRHFSRRNAERVFQKLSWDPTIVQSALIEIGKRRPRNPKTFDAPIEGNT